MIIRKILNIQVPRKNGKTARKGWGTESHDKKKEREAKSSGGRKLGCL